MGARQSLNHVCSGFDQIKSNFWIVRIFGVPVLCLVQVTAPEVIIDHADPLDHVWMWLAWDIRAQFCIHVTWSSTLIHCKMPVEADQS